MHRVERRAAFQVHEAVSFVVNCASPEEVDYYWEKLSAGGDENAQPPGVIREGPAQKCRQRSLAMRTASSTPW